MRYEGGSESSVIGSVTLLIDMTADTLIEIQFSFIMIKIMPEINKYLEIDERHLG